jgi:hypothetical protein
MRPRDQKRGFTIKDGKIIVDEDRVHYQVVKYLKLRYPKLLFHTDAAGELMLESMRMRQGKLNLQGFSFPDLQIMEARGGWFGLLIEMKRDNENLYTASGLFKDDRLSRQDRTIKALNERNYLAMFCKGFDQIRKAIDDYMALPPTKVSKPKIK